METAHQSNGQPNASMILHTNKFDQASSQWKFLDTDHFKELINKNPDSLIKLLSTIWTEAEKLIETALSKKEKDTMNESIFIKANDQIINLKFNDILWVEAYGDYVNFFTDKTRYLVHSTMKGIESKLPKEKFTRVHRSFIIHTDKIDLIDESIIQIGKKLIPIGESYRNELMSRLNLL